MVLTAERLYDVIDVKRNVWDPTEVSKHSRYGERSYGSITGVEVHWVGTGALHDHGDTSSELLAFEKYHEQTKGWYDLFYQVGIDSEGFTYEGRHATIPSQSDLKSWLTCLFVAGEKDPPPPIQMYRRLYDVWGAVDPTRSPKTLRYHGERASSACPGPDIQIAVKLMRGGWNPYLTEGSTMNFEDLPKKQADVSVWGEIGAVNDAISTGEHLTDLAARWEAILMSDRAYRESKKYADKAASKALADAKDAASAGDTRIQKSVDKLANAVEQLGKEVANAGVADVDVDEIVAATLVKVLKALDGKELVANERTTYILDL